MKLWAVLLLGFAVYYGPDPSLVDGYHLLILSPLVEPPEGHLNVGYISLATVGGWEPWANGVEPIVVGRNEVWDELVVNYSSPLWRRKVLEEAVPYVLSRGFDGVFLDNLDYVDELGGEEDMVALVRAIRERYPNITIVVNRGFTIMGEIAPYADYLLFEDFTGSPYDGYIVAAAREFGLQVLALSYEPNVGEICPPSIEFGVLWNYAADLSLMKPGFDPCSLYRVSAPARLTSPSLLSL